jgi:hypothetical protein
MEDNKSGEIILKNLDELNILAKIHDDIINTRTQEEIDHGNPLKGEAVIKLRHIARYILQRKINDATDGHRNIGSADKTVSS